jgi:hypothetical protein
MKNQVAVILGILSAISVASQAGANPSWNLASDWSSSNPSGVWSYGHYTGGLSPSSFSQFTENYYGGVVTPDDLTKLNAWGEGGDPNIIKNTGPTFTTVNFGQITFNAGAVTFGPYLGPTVVRFTAPTAGNYDLSDAFMTVQVANSDPNAYISIDGGALNDLGLVSGTISDSQEINLAGGQYVDLIVWGGDTNNKTTQVDATFTLVPDGSITAGLLGSALIGLATLRRKLAC